MVVPILLTLAQAKAHLRLTEGEDSPLSIEDQDLQDKITEATAIVIEYIRREDNEVEIEQWTNLGELPSPASPSTEAPRAVIAAIKIQLGDLYRFRGDDEATDQKRDRGYLAPGVANLLTRQRDPVVA